MREIKFKAYLKKEKKIYKVIRISFWTDEIYLSVYKDGLYSYSLNENEVELLQCIGEKDKTGKELYEGDIVKFRYKDWIYNPKTGKHKFGFCEATGYIKYANGEYQVEQITGKDTLAGNAFYSPDGREFNWNELEIIGNRFENPELMEEDKCLTKTDTRQGQK